MNFGTILFTLIMVVHTGFADVTSKFEHQALLFTTTDQPKAPESTAIIAPVRIEPKIINGTDAAPNEFPYQVEMKENGTHTCGGTILNQDYVLTAAHCVENVSSDWIQIVAGEHSIVQVEDLEQFRKVQAIKMHENYDPKHYEAGNDIALLRLEHPLKFTPQVQPVILPEPNYNVTEKHGVVSGWGQNGTHNKSEILQTVTLTVMSNEECNDAYMGLEHIPDTSFCASFLGKDSCQGDSGGPMTLRMPNGSYFLIGIVSYGRGCADPSFPGVYIRVSEYLQWIQSNAV